MKNRKMFWKMIFSSLARRKSRMLTALLAITMGATILSGLVTIYYDVPRQLGKEFRNYGANLIIIPGDSDKKITKSDCENILSLLPKEKVVGVAPYIYETCKVNELPFMIAASNLEEVKKNSPYWLITGDWPKEKREVLIGEEIKNQTGISEGENIILDVLDSTGNLKQREFLVSGVVTTGGKEEEMIFMSENDIYDITGKNDFDVIELSVEGDNLYLENLANELINQNENIYARKVKRVTESQDIVLSKLQSLVWIVTIIVLFIMMICVYTTMMAVVTERKKEIGLKKALGANNKEIVREFFSEGVVLGILGGLLGVVLGYLFANQVSISVFARKINFLPLFIPATVAISVIITIIASIIPVRKTVDIDPALVLRGE